jgi:hypothetical protein
MNPKCGISGCARSVANDLFCLLKRHNALTLVGFCTLALGILKQDHDALALIRCKLSRFPLKTRPSGRLTGTNGLEVARLRLVLGHASLLGILPLRTSVQENRGSGSYDEYFHEIRLPHFARPPTGILTNSPTTRQVDGLRTNKLNSAPMPVPPQGHPSTSAARGSEARPHTIYAPKPRASG